MVVSEIPSCLENIFLELDVELINSIPLSRFPKSDRLKWHFDLATKFSVKSAYSLAFDRENGGNHTHKSNLGP